MAFDKAFAYLEKKGFGDRAKEFEVSSATVELAAIAVGTEPAHIAKSLTFMLDDGPIMVVCAGDMKVNSSKFKKEFGKKPRMLTRDQVNELIGHDVGGVCPFGINDGVRVYLDSSMQRFELVYPACGSGNSAVELTPDEFFDVSEALKWVDVCVEM